MEICDLWQLCASQLQHPKILCVSCVRCRPLCSHCVVDSRDSRDPGRSRPDLPPPPLPLSSQPEQPDQAEQQQDNLLSVRKPAVGRTHSLPNDSYMFPPLQPLGHAAPAALQEPQHKLDTLRSQSGQ